MSKDKILNEDLREKDLNGFISEIVTVDRFKSKMGEDQDIIVLGFKVKEKYPALDLVEFIEKGYDFILDADMSAGEEHDGQYQVFVEVERTNKFPGQLKDLLRGIERLTDNVEWRLRYQSEPNSIELNSDTILEKIPLTPADYEKYMFERKTNDLKEFFDQGSTELSLGQDNTVTFSKPFSDNVSAKFVSIGEYEDVIKTIPGALDISESGQGEVLFLTKFLGNYDIDKIGNKFLIRNGDRAVVLQKDRT